MTSERDEDAWVARILDEFTSTSALLVPAGHDCAVLDLGGAPAVVTTDVLVDGVHFEIEACGPEAAGAKALLVNLSDLAAAAAIPVGFEVGVVLPRHQADAWLPGLAKGLARVASRYGCALAGGDTNVAEGRLTLAVTAIGRPGPAGVLTREGARPGDLLSVTGALGGSRLGRHLTFVPRLAEAQTLAELGLPHAMMDLSDGLGRDLPRLCARSGVGARIEAASIPVHEDVDRLEDGGDPVRHALDDGEDFELLVAHAPLLDEHRSALERAGVLLHPVGTVTDASEGLALVDRQGQVERWRPRGWDHFDARRSRGT